MGVMKKAMQAASKHARTQARRPRGYRAVGGSAGVNMIVTAQISENVKTFPNDFAEAMQSKVLVKGGRKAAQIVQKEMKRLLRDYQSSKSGSTRKQSQKTRQYWRDRVPSLYKSVKISQRTDKKNNETIFQVGVSGEGNTIVGWWIEYGRKRYLWGEEPQDLSDVVAPYPFTRMAGDNTRAQQEAALTSHVKSNWDKA